MNFYIRCAAVSIASFAFLFSSHIKTEQDAPEKVAKSSEKVILATTVLPKSLTN